MRFATIVLAVALPALAQAPSNFRSNAPLMLERKDALHRAELPLEAYRDGRKDLGDVRVFNAAGDAVPYAWAPDPGKVVEKGPSVELPMFPVRTVPAPGVASTEVSLKASDGTIVTVKNVRSQPPIKGLNATKPAAYYFDATKTTEQVHALVFAWEAVPGSELVTVRVEGSEDLKSWSTIGTAPLVRLAGQEGRALLQPRVEFTPRTVKYLRATWDQPAFVPTAVRAEYAPRGKAPPRIVRTIEGTRGTEKPDDIVFDLGARLPVEAMRLLPAQDNAVLVATMYLKNEPEEQWRAFNSSTFYRLQREGVESLSPVRELGGKATARYWMARLAPGSSQGPLPKLEIHWRPARLVFVAQGEGPFHLAFGSPQSTPTALPIESVIPDYKLGQDEILPLAKVGAVQAGPPPTRWDALIGSMSPRRIALWAILIVGVAALGFMAWRLSKQVK